MASNETVVNADALDERIVEAATKVQNEYSQATMPGDVLAMSIGAIARLLRRHGSIVDGLCAAIAKCREITTTNRHDIEELKRRLERLSAPSATPENDQPWGGFDGASVTITIENVASYPVTIDAFRKGGGIVRTIPPKESLEVEVSRDTTIRVRPTSLIR